MDFWIINIIIVFVLGLIFGISELIARYNDPKYIFRVWQAYIYLLLNAIVSVVALLLLKYFRNQDTTTITTIEINNVIIAGLGGMMILRSSFFSVKIKESKVDIGIGTIVQIFLDLIEKKMKNSAAALKINEINKIMKGIIFEDAKLELTTMCINSIDNFSKADNDLLIKKIEEISNLDIGNTNKVIQVGISISQYCDNDILRNSIEVLGLNKNLNKSELTNVVEGENIDFYLEKLKKQ